MAAASGAGGDWTGGGGCSVPLASYDGGISLPAVDDTDTHCSLSVQELHAFTQQVNENAILLQRAHTLMACLYLHKEGYGGVPERTAQTPISPSDVRTWLAHAVLVATDNTDVDTAWPPLELRSLCQRLRDAVQGYILIKLTAQDEDERVSLQPAARDVEGLAYAAPLLLHHAVKGTYVVGVCPYEDAQFIAGAMQDPQCPLPYQWSCDVLWALLGVNIQRHRDSQLQLVPLVTENADARWALRAANIPPPISVLAPLQKLLQQEEDAHLAEDEDTASQYSSSSDDTSSSGDSIEADADLAEDDKRAEIEAGKDYIRHLIGRDFIA